MHIVTATKCAVRITIETRITLFVENEDDTLITQVGHLVGRDTVLSYYVSILLGGIIQTVDSLEGLPHTGIVHIVEYRISVLCRTAALEVHTTDVLTTLYPTS